VPFDVSPSFAHGCARMLDALMQNVLFGNPLFHPVSPDLVGMNVFAPVEPGPPLGRSYPGDVRFLLPRTGARVGLEPLLGAKSPRLSGVPMEGDEVGKEAKTSRSQERTLRRLRHHIDLVSGTVSRAMIWSKKPTWSVL
jgi:hypothetical protein